MMPSRSCSSSTHRPQVAENLGTTEPSDRRLAGASAASRSTHPFTAGGEGTWSYRLRGTLSDAAAKPIEVTVSTGAPDTARERNAIGTAAAG